VNKPGGRGDFIFIRPHHGPWTAWRRHRHMICLSVPFNGSDANRGHVLVAVRPGAELLGFQDRGAQTNSAASRVGEQDRGQPVGPNVSPLRSRSSSRPSVWSRSRSPCFRRNSGPRFLFEGCRRDQPRSGPGRARRSTTGESSADQERRRMARPSNLHLPARPVDQRHRRGHVALAVQVVAEVVVRHPQRALDVALGLRQRIRSTFRAIPSGPRDSPRPRRCPRRRWPATVRSRMKSKKSPLISSAGP